MSNTPRYWFHAKRYGWGWGLPATWQGWTVRVGWLVAMTAAGVIVAPRSLPWFSAATALLPLALVAICQRTGEPPRWRWGD